MIPTLLVLRAHFAGGVERPHRMSGLPIGVDRSGTHCSGGTAQGALAISLFGAAPCLRRRFPSPAVFTLTTSNLCLLLLPLYSTCVRVLQVVCWWFVSGAMSRAKQRRASLLHPRRAAAAATRMRRLDVWGSSYSM